MDSRTGIAQTLEQNLGRIGQNMSSDESGSVCDDVSFPAAAFTERATLRRLVFEALKLNSLYKQIGIYCQTL